MSVKRNPNLGPSQMRQRRRRLFFIRFYIILFLLLFTILGLAIFSGSDKLKIQTIIVSGNAAVSSDDILSIVNRDMMGRYGYLFSKSNSLIFPRYQIKKDLLEEIKTIKDLDVNWDNLQQISIIITERKPHSVWCDELSNCYFVDKSGYVYSQAPVFSGSMFIKVYGNVSTSTSPVGQFFLPKRVYEEIFVLIDLLEEKKITINTVTFDGIDYRFNLESGPAIIFNTTNSFEQSFGNLFGAIETKNLDLEKEAGSIKYIDLRFDNKIVIGKKTD